ncbi:heavy metal translocating P-type ATPase [Faecalicoccus pleomorphus]|uniref:heavy metal translocating P-type ATPase n=1 Tax=Faecalicoccus pleomorphus TaxID=1323 RepID=UPI00242D8AF7|nr:heavy metal translocating P-type ATPase [Faecalicoccus pleomorphus]
MKKQFDVTGMTCSACQANVTRAVSRLDGVEKVDVSLLSNSMRVEYDEAKTSAASICDAVEHAGYVAREKGTKKEDASFQEEWDQKRADAKKEQDASFHRLLVSILLLIPLMLIAMGPMLGLPILAGENNAMISGLSQVLISMLILCIQRHFFIHGFKSLFHKAPNMDSLVAIGSGASFLYGLYALYRMAYGFGYGDMMMVHHSMHALYFESAAMIVTLVSVGKYLESRSKRKTGDALDKLMDLSPKNACVIRDGKEQMILASELMPHDQVVIRPGDRVPADGIILSGNGVLDQSAITGESVPVDKEVGDTVISATLNQNGSFIFEATKVGQDTTLAQIIKLVDEAGNSKAPIARVADQVSGIFVPIVIGIAIVTGIVWILAGQSFEFALSNAVAVLVISCPCALGLATPVAIMVSTGKAAEYGILIKNAAALENMAHMDTIVLDKTGTITSGKPSVQQVVTDLDQKQFLALAASLEVGSGHPLAKAVVDHAQENKVDLLPIDQFESISGKGIKGVVQGKRLLAGNYKFCKEQGVVFTDEIVHAIEEAAAKGWTPLIFVQEQKVIGWINVADTIKETSKAAIQAFKEKGMHVVMLTGDNQKTAKTIAKELLVDEVISDVLPTDKENVIRTLQGQGRKVIMVGDGINDAPALMRADIGIAIGNGTDIAIDSADVVLMKSSLLDVNTAIDLSRKTIRNIHMNLFWAFFYNALGIPLAAGIFYPFFGWLLSPMIGSAAMSLSSVCVCTNALRLRWFKPEIVMEIQETKQQEKKVEEEKMTKTMKIEGMMCQHCVAHVKKALEDVAGVTEADVDLESGSAKIEMETDVKEDILKKAVEDAGYTPVSVE